MAQRPGPAGATTITPATKNIQLVDETQNTLSELYYATRNLAAHLIPAGEIMTELRGLSDHATEISTAAGYELPA
ncbi:MAG TPA: hypothetical protein VE127_00065, partial [Solirubrobacteraceae bacterium]|nr:hypothetical protein [Solirubrobacteraceae bacterium]